MTQLTEGASTDAVVDFDPFNSPDKENPFAALALAREVAPVFRSSGLGTWVVTRYDDILAILRDPETFSSAASITNRPGPPPEPLLAVLAKGIPYVPNSVDLDPPEHSKFRGLINKAFTPRRIAGMEPHITALSEGLLESFVDGNADLVEQFAYPLPTLVIGQLLGVPDEDMGEFKRWSDEWLVMLGQLGDMDRLLQAAEAVVEFQLYVQQMIVDRRDVPTPDLVSAVVAAAGELDDPPSDVALVGLLMTVMFAGHETTTSLITNTVKQLAMHPEQLAQVRADRSLVPAAITEALRFDPPVPNMYRTTTTDTEVGGVEMPAGSHMALSFASANRDPQYFADPDTFDIHRTDKNNLLSFGKGIHYCIGAALSQLEGRVGINVLLDRLDGLDIVADQVVEPRVSATVRGTEQLLITWNA